MIDEKVNYCTGCSKQCCTPVRLGVFDIIRNYLYALDNEEYEIVEGAILKDGVEQLTYKYHLIGIIEGEVGDKEGECIKYVNDSCVDHDKKVENELLEDYGLNTEIEPFICVSFPYYRQRLLHEYFNYFSLGKDLSYKCNLTKHVMISEEDQAKIEKEMDYLLKLYDFYNNPITQKIKVPISFQKLHRGELSKEGVNEMLRVLLKGLDEN
jgi:hypothetical protein